MPHHARLLADGNVRLIVFVGPRPVARRVVATRQRLLGEVMRLATPFVDEIGREIEAAAVARQAIELDEREFDFLVTRVAALLSGTAAEDACDVIDVALHHVEQPPPPGCAKISDRAFEQMSGVVELVVVAEVRPALFRLAAVVPAVEIAVGRLGSRKIVDDRVDLPLDVGIAPVGKGVARRLDPLAHVRIPEHLHGETVAVSRDFQRRNGLRQFERLQNAGLLEFRMLAQDRAAEHDLEPLSPEGAGDANVGERRRRICTLSHDRLSGPIRSAWRRTRRE